MGSDLARLHIFKQLYSVFFFLKLVFNFQILYLNGTCKQQALCIECEMFTVGMC